MIVKRQQPSASPRQDCALAVWVGRRRSFGLVVLIHGLNLNDGDNSSVLATIDPSSSSTSILALLSIAICVDRVVTSRFLMNVSVTGLRESKLAVL
jgi:hypothetical protein